MPSSNAPNPTLFSVQPTTIFNSSIIPSSLSQFPTHTMKMIKAMKKLKFWSRKKRKKKPHDHPYNYYYQPPSTCHHHCCSSTQPSAPPLPPWLDLEPPDETVYATCSSVHHAPEPAYPSQTQFTFQEVVAETSPLLPPLASDTDSTQSYQQYMAPNPVYGLPVVESARRERASGFFGCVVSFSANLIRCFCPCFHIREAYYKEKY